MLKVLSNNFWCGEIFESINEVCNNAIKSFTNFETNGKHHHKHAIEHYMHNKDWFVDKVEDFRAGDKTAINKLFEMYTKNLGKTNKFIRMTPAVYGGYPCVQNYIQGLPNQMYTTKFQRKPAKRLNLIINISFSSVHSDRDIAPLKLVLLSVITALKKSNYNLDVIALRYEPSRYLFGSYIYRNNEGFNFKNIASLMSDSTFLRLIKFWWVYNNEYYDGGNQGGFMSRTELENFIMTELGSSIFNEDSYCINEEYMIWKLKMLGVSGLADNILEGIMGHNYNVQKSRIIVKRV